MGDSNTGTVKKNKGGRPKGSVNPNKKYTMSEKALAQRRAVSPDVKASQFLRNQIETQEGREYNAALINHIMQINEISLSADKSDVNTLKSCFINYLKLCQANGFNVSNLNAYASMGFNSVREFDNYCKRYNVDPERKTLAAFVRRTCGMFRESLIADSKLNPVIGIFWQRNFDGLRNDTEQVQSSREQEEDNERESSYKEKYKNLIGDEK